MARTMRASIAVCSKLYAARAFTVSMPRGKQWGHEGCQSDNISLHGGATDAGGKRSC